MGALVLPVATLEVNGTSVRFFAAPGFGPQLAWHAVDDLYRAIGFTPNLRRQLLRLAQQFPHSPLVTVATAEGLVVIAPPIEAEETIAAATDARRVEEEFLDLYNRAAAAALVALCSDLAPEEQIAYMAEAALNTGGLVEDDFDDYDE